MAFMNILPLAAGPSDVGLVNDQVREIITTFNTESLLAMAQPNNVDYAWADQGTKVTAGTGIVKVPVRFLSGQNFTPLAYGAPRDYSSIDVTAVEIKTALKQLNYAWPMVPDTYGKMGLLSPRGDGTYDEFYGSSGIAEAIMEGSRAHKAMQVATIIYQSMTSAASSITATITGVAEPGYPAGLPLFTNGTDSASHFANPFNASSARFNTLYQPGIANAVGFTGGPFNATWLGQMITAMTQVPHPSLANSTMGLQVTDIIGPTWMKIPFWQAAVQSLQLQTATMGGNGVAAAVTNPFNADLLRSMGPEKLIGTAGVAPQNYWTTSLLDNHPYALANPTAGPGGGPPQFCIAVCAQKPRVQTWCEIAMSNVNGAPWIDFFGPGDPTSISEQRVRLLSTLHAGAKPGMYHFASMWLGS